MKILFCSSEAYPFAVSGGLGDVSSALPKALRSRKVACRVVMPLYSSISGLYRDQMEYLTSFYVPLAWRNQYCGVFRLNQDGVIYYFLDNEYYFKRSGLYGHFDDGERFAFFSKAVLEMLKHIDFAPDLIHANDWQCALICPFLNLFYRRHPKFAKIKTLFTIHNIQYQGEFSPYVVGDILGISPYDAGIVTYNGNANYMKGAIECADIVSTVSPTYSDEILDPYFAHKLDVFLREKSFKLRGILNGIDYDVYNPEKDSFIAENFSVSRLEGKEQCKKELLKEFSLPDDQRPVLGMVSRLAGHKGFEIVKSALERIVSSGIKVVILGTGEPELERFFSDFAKRHPDSCSCRLAFMSDVAHRVYAGSDMFLMPSKSEPCGLSQMIALRYGAIPIVRETGGLKDTIHDASLGRGNGFTFISYNADDLFNAVSRAHELYVNHPDWWRKLVVTAMNCDNSWKGSAAKYIALYDEIIRSW